MEIEPAREGSADALRRLSRSPGRRRGRSTILVYLDVEVHTRLTRSGPSTFKRSSTKPMTTFIRPNVLNRIVRTCKSIRTKYYAIDIQLFKQIGRSRSIDMHVNRSQAHWQDKCAQTLLSGNIEGRDLFVKHFKLPIREKLRK